MSIKLRPPGIQDARVAGSQSRSFKFLDQQNADGMLGGLLTQISIECLIMSGIDSSEVSLPGYKVLLLHSEGSIEVDGMWMQLLVQKWDARMSREILAHWLDLMNSQGWIAREQVHLELPSCARAGSELRDSQLPQHHYLHQL